MPDREFCELIKAHFESHPMQAGEKNMRERINSLLENTEPDDVIKLDIKEKIKLANQFSETRIRETKIEDAYRLPSLKNFSRDDFKMQPMAEVNQQGTKITVDKINARLCINSYEAEMDRKMGYDKYHPSNVYVQAETAKGSYTMIGQLPEQFLKNNPMKRISFDAELELVDFSNGKMKNISAKIILDTDIMSDIIRNDIYQDFEDAVNSMPSYDNSMAQ